MEDRLDRLERNVRWLRAYAVALTSLLLIVGLVAAGTERPDTRILRARGLVLVDEAGRERILLGAPVPEAANRVRTDPDRVAEVWGPRFPAEYLEWYKGYAHTTNGLLILDERGFDRIALGDPVPDPNIGKRIGPSTGIAINDERGFERSGYGLLDVAGSKRVVLGLDTAKGTEGLTLSVRDEGGTGLSIATGGWSAFLGNTPSGRHITGNDEPLRGLVVRDDKGQLNRYPPATESRE